jgi:hypothetical protein
MSTSTYQEAVEALLTFREILHVGTFTKPDCDTIASAYKVLEEAGLDEWSEAVSVAVSHRDVDSEASLTAYWCYQADQAVEALQAVIEGASYDVLDGVHLAHWKPNTVRAIVPRAEAPPPQGVVNALDTLNPGDRPSPTAIMIADLA